MAWQLNYYSARVAALVEAWPTGIRAGFLRIVELMQVHGPDIGMPHTRAMGAGLSKCAQKAVRASAERFTAPWLASAS